MEEILSIQIVVNEQRDLNLPFDILPSLTLESLSGLITQTPGSMVYLSWLDHHGHVIPIERTQDLHDAAQAQINEGEGSFTVRFHATISELSEDDFLLQETALLSIESVSNQRRATSPPPSSPPPLMRALSSLDHEECIFYLELLNPYDYPRRHLRPDITGRDLIALNSPEDFEKAGVNPGWKVRIGQHGERGVRQSSLDECRAFYAIDCARSQGTSPFVIAFEKRDFVVFSILCRTYEYIVRSLDLDGQLC